MFSRYRQRNPGRPLRHLLWWDLVCQPLSWAALSLCWGHRWWGHHRIPSAGPTLLICNHQSYLDLLVLGIGLRRHFHSMARKTLFRKPAFAWFIRSLNAFEVDQSKGDLKAMRTAIDLLKQGHLVLVFPEGSRTEDGRLGPFSPGVMLLIKRARPMVVPMAVDGVFDIWKIHQNKPKLRGRTGAEYGEPIAPDTLLAMEPNAAMKLLANRVQTLRLSVRRKLRHLSDGDWPPPGPGDAPTVPRVR